MNIPIHEVITKNVPLIKPILMGVVLALAVAWAYSGLHYDFSSKGGVGTTSTEMSNVTPLIAPSTSSSSSVPISLQVNSNDDAVRAYLKEAQVHAEIYKFTNHGVYDGMCELTDKNNLFNLELGVMRYIKAVGATGVYCFTSSDQYMIEAKLPQKGVYECIDSTGYQGEQTVSHQKDQSCGKN